MFSAVYPFLIFETVFYKLLKTSVVCFLTAKIDDFKKSLYSVSIRFQKKRKENQDGFSLDNKEKTEF